MTSKQAKKLKIGDKVQTDKLPVGEHHEGEVTDAGYTGVTITWDDGQIGSVHFDDMAVMGSVEKKEN